MSVRLFIRSVSRVAATSLRDGHALVVLSVVTLAAVGLASVQAASAHGGGFSLDRRASAGPYELRLGTIPNPLTVGEGILIMEVLASQTGERVSSADVVITPQRPDGAADPYGALETWPDSYDPTLYESRVELDAEGAWAFRVSVSGDAGAGTALFAYEVRRVSPVGGIITLFVLLVLLTILGLSMRAFLNQRDSGQRVKRRRA